MNFEPNAVVFYVNDIVKSSDFYQEILGISPEKPSATFCAFNLSNGMAIALKDKHYVRTHMERACGGAELSFTVADREQVDRVFSQWRQKGVQMIEEPFEVPFGYNFMAVDPDGHQLRVVALN